MKKSIVIFVLCVLIYWCGRIYSINQTPPINNYYNIGDSLDCGDLRLYFAESHLDEPDEFNNRFGIDYGDLEEYKVLSFCIEVENASAGNIKWSEIFGFLECGFESSVWASSVDPMAGSEINRFNSEYLAPGETQRIWFATDVRKVCFKDSSWEKLSDYQYSYVLSLVPQKIAVRLDV